jgi:hypothetical protein
VLHDPLGEHLAGIVRRVLLDEAPQQTAPPRLTAEPNENVAFGLGTLPFMARLVEEAHECRAMPEQSPKDLGATANLLLVFAVLLAIVGTGVIVLVYGPLISARVGEATQTVPFAAALTPPADIDRR